MKVTKPKTKQRPYQVEGIKKITDGFNNGNRAWMLADPAGAGKSLQALMILKNQSKNFQFKRVLIMCPAFLKKNWVKEINKWLPKKRKYIIIIKTYSEIIDVHILNHVTKYKYDFCILDEVHYLKDFDSQRTMAVLGAPGFNHVPVIKRCKLLLALSATPVCNRVGEVYPWLWATKHPLLKGVSFEKFIATYAKSFRLTKYGLTHKGIKNAGVLRKAMAARMVRRSKEEVYKHLPAANRDFITLPCSAKVYDEEKDLLRELLELTGYAGQELESLLRNPAFIQELLEAMPSFEALSIFKKQQGLIKIKPVMSYLKANVIAGTPKFILFTYHRDVADKYFEQLSKIKTLENVRLVNGNMAPDERFEVIQEVNKLEQCVLVATMHSIKEGLDIDGFNTSFFCELDWAPYVLEQAEGRTRRLTQKLPVFWNYFLFDKGIEQYIYNTINEKNVVIKELVG